MLPHQSDGGCRQGPRASTSWSHGLTGVIVIPDDIDEPSPAGVQPVSITISRHGLVYVANVGSGGSNYLAPREVVLRVQALLRR